MKRYATTIFYQKETITSANKNLSTANSDGQAYENRSLVADKSYYFPMGNALSRRLYSLPVIWMVVP